MPLHFTLRQLEYFLAVGEAGGAVGFLDGRGYSPLIDEGCLIAANSETTLERLRERLAASGMSV